MIGTNLLKFYSKVKIKILSKISKYADILELGFPHNTPIADGGQIGSASDADAIAIASDGVGLLNEILSTLI